MTGRSKMNERLHDVLPNRMVLVYRQRNTLENKVQKANNLNKTDSIEISNTLNIYTVNYMISPTL